MKGGALTPLPRVLYRVSLIYIILNMGGPYIRLLLWHRGLYGAVIGILSPALSRGVGLTIYLSRGHRHHRILAYVDHVCVTVTLLNGYEIYVSVQVYGCSVFTYCIGGFVIHHGREQRRFTLCLLRDVEDGRPH